MSVSKEAWRPVHRLQRVHIPDQCDSIFILNLYRLTNPFLSFLRETVPGMTRQTAQSSFIHITAFILARRQRSYVRARVRVIKSRAHHVQGPMPGRWIVM